jgi:23S rRNA pseudouridine2605 synthase
MRARSEPERLQKVLARLGLGSRRQVETWIKAGRLMLNGRPARLGDRLAAGDRLQLDGRPVRLDAARAGAAGLPLFLCNRSPGQLLVGSGRADAAASLAAGLPRRAGRRYVSISPMPLQDGGLELLTADGALAARLQRAVRSLPIEFRVRVRGEITGQQAGGVLGGELDRGARLPIGELQDGGGEGANRWYRITATGVSGSDLRQLLERQGVAVSRVLRLRLGPLVLERSLPRGHSRALEAAERQALLEPAADEATGSSAAVR